MPLLERNFSSTFLAPRRVRYQVMKLSASTSITRQGDGNALVHAKSFEDMGTFEDERPDRLERGYQRQFNMLTSNG